MFVYHLLTYLQEVKIIWKYQGTSCGCHDHSDKKSRPQIVELKAADVPDNFFSRQTFYESTDYFGAFATIMFEDYNMRHIRGLCLTICEIFLFLDHLAFCHVGRTFHSARPGVKLHHQVLDTGRRPCFQTDQTDRTVYVAAPETGVAGTGGTEIMFHLSDWRIDNNALMPK